MIGPKDLGKQKVEIIEETLDYWEEMTGFPPGMSRVILLYRACSSATDPTTLCRICSRWLRNELMEFHRP